MPTIKFGILVLPDFQTFSRSSYLPFDLSEGVQVLKGPLKDQLKAESLKHWGKWLGSIEWESIEDRRVYLRVIRNSDDPETNNAEDSKIHKLLLDAYMALMISAPLRSQENGPTIMTGHGLVQNNILDAKVIHGVSPLNPWVESHYMYERGYHTTRSSYLRSKHILDDWKLIFERLRKFRKRKRGTEAISVAIESLRRGLESTYLDFRIPYFVRTCEAIMAPKVGQTKTAFVSRAESLLHSKPRPLFISKRTDIKTLLNDLFEIRNSAVHGMPFGWKVSKRVKSKRRVCQYAYLAEECARRALRFALSNDELIKASGDRKKLEEWCTNNW